MNHRQIIFLSMLIVYVCMFTSALLCVTAALVAGKWLALIPAAISAFIAMIAKRFTVVIMTNAKNS